MAGLAPAIHVFVRGVSVDARVKPGHDERERRGAGGGPWPKSMRFPASGLRWVRPLVSVICLFDGAILPLALDQIPVGRMTRGHRFLSEGEISVENAQDYREKLEAAHVILDHDRRRDLI